MVPQKANMKLYLHGFSLSLMCLILLLGQLEITVVAKGPNYYTAAVFEHVRYSDVTKSPEEAIKTNLERYATATKAAAMQDTDIIVFPEWGIYFHDKNNRSTVLPFAEDVPDPSEEQHNPCEDQSVFADRPVLLYLSCLARDNNLFLVANIADVKQCTPKDVCESSDCSADPKQCPPDGRKFFNTNVVFNRKGALVSRYYKSHLYFEPDFNVPVYPKPAYFKTDFGLFTTFICFDMSFREAVEAVERKNIVNVAYPTFWFDHMPLMAAIQYQQAWAMTNKVNLLAADVHLLGTGTIGSGIYAGTKGALVYTFNPDGDAKLLVSRVPTTEFFPEDFDTNAKIFRIKDGDVQDITDEKQDSNVPEQCSRKILGLSKDLTKDYRCSELSTKGHNFNKLTEASGSLEVCENGICCSLSYTADSMHEDFYLGVNSGIEWVYNTYGFCVELCILVRCDKGSDEEGCSTYPLVSQTRFQNFNLRGNFTTKYVYPSVMGSKMRLVPAKEWKFHTGDGDAEITFSSESEDGELLLSAGLYGRCYDKDPPPRL